MIVHGGVSEMYTNERLKELGLSEECFFSLPYEYQRALLNSGLDAVNKDKENARKKIALAQYDLEEKVKEKVLVLFKRKK